MTNKKLDDFHITLLRSNNLAESWQPELHVVFILRGTGKFLYKTVYTVHEGDIFTINGLEGQNLSLGENAIALSLSISFDFIASVCPDILQYHMNCYSFLTYRKFLKSSEMVYNDNEIKISMTKERRYYSAMTLFMRFFVLVWLHYLTIEKE